MGGAAPGGSEAFGGAPATGGNAAAGNASSGGSSLRVGGNAQSGAGGTQAIGGDATQGTAGLGGSSAPTTGGNTFGSTAGVAGSGGDPIPNTGSSGGNAGQGGNSTSGTAGVSGDSTNGGTAGAAGREAGGSAGRGGSVTVYDLAEFLLSPDVDTSTGVWRLRSMQRVPQLRDEALTALKTPTTLLATSYSYDPVLITWGMPPLMVCANPRYTPYGNSTVVFPPRSVSTGPGPKGEYAVIAWVAPSAGIATINAEFLGIDTYSAGTTADVHILVKGQPVWSDSVDGTFDRAVYKSPPIPPFSVEVGDTIDFAVGMGSNNDHFDDTTEVRVVITLKSS